MDDVTIRQTGRVWTPTGVEWLAMQCRSCGGSRVRLVLDLGHQPNANRLVRASLPAGAEPVYPLRLGYCDDCTLLQIDHTIPRDDMFRDYVYVSGTTQTLREHFIETTRRLRDAFSVGARDLVVDIGSNDGTWLKTWGSHQKRLGVEPAPQIAESAVYAGVPTMNAYFDLTTARDIVARKGQAKLITSAGSFFHMEDLHGACEGVYELLEDEGVFVCQAIAADDMIQGNAFDQVLHEHLCFYTPRSFANLIRPHGLELFDWRHHPIHGGTWEYHVRRRQPGARKQTPIGVSDVDCEAFAARVVGLRDDVLRVLRDYRNRGKTVWAYGAPGKGGTLLNSFGIGPDLVQCAIEANPIKFGLSIPGCRIPIIDERGAGRPDAYLVLAWNFVDEFERKEREWLDAGGEFIVPVPEVRVIGGLPS